MMQEIKRVLKPEGILIISSPNRLVYSDEPKYSNPFHVKELYFDEFNRLLGQYFKHILMYGQRLATGSFVYSIGESFTKTYKAFTGDARGLHPGVTSLPSPVYFIAICSNNPLGDQHATDSVYIDEVDDLYKISESDRKNLIKNMESQAQQIEGAAATQRATYEAQINQLAQELARVRAQHETQLNLEREQLLAKDRQLQEAVQQLRNAQQLLHEKEQELEASDIKIGEYLLQMQEKDLLLESLNISRQAEGLQLQPQFAASQLAPQPESFDEAALLQDIQRQLGERESYLRAKDLQLEEMEQRLQMCHHVVENFGKSSSYRLGRFLTWPLRKIKGSS
jgi:hypothetical protein